MGNNGKQAGVNHEASSHASGPEQENQTSVQSNFLSVSQFRNQVRGCLLRAGLTDHG